MDDAVIVARSIQAETTALLQRQRRSGLEYRFRVGMGRPVELSDAALTCEPSIESSFRSRPLGPSVSGAPLPSLVASKSSETARSMHSTALRIGDVGVKLGDYDPKAVLAHDHRALVESVAQLRADASRARHDTERLKLRAREADAELAGIRYEDEVSSEHASWRGAVADFRSRIGTFRARLEEVEAYGITLRHMLSRDSNDSIAHKVTLEALEAGLRAQRSEAERHKALLLLVVHSRDAETTELSRVRHEARRFIALLDGKLESRRVEVQASVYERSTGKCSELSTLRAGTAREGTLGTPRAVS